MYLFAVLIKSVRRWICRSCSVRDTLNLSAPLISSDCDDDRHQILQSFLGPEPNSYANYRMALTIGSLRSYLAYFHYGIF